MFGWLQKKSENARVYMCVKELKWELEQATQLRRAKILAMAQLLREGFEMPSFDDAIENPYDYPREEMAQMYSIMEDMRNGAKVQLSQLQNSFRQMMGMEFPDEWADHVLLTNRAIEVWMTLFGCGLAPDVRDDVRIIWKYLKGSKELLEDAMNDLRGLSKSQAEFTGQDIFANFGKSNEDWAKLCDYVPTQFSKSLF